VDVKRFSADAGAVLDSLGDRLPADDQDSLRTYLQTGEWGLLADELAAALLEDATPIATAERDLVRDLLFAFTLTPDDAELHPCIRDRERVLAALNVVSDPPAPSPSPPPRSPDR
jgi:hypothetical protein